MKLLQINVTVNSGSTGRIAEEIGQTAIAAGWKSFVAYGRERNMQSKSETIRIGNNKDILFHGLQTRLFDNHSLGLSSKNSTKKFIKKIRKIKPDIIHLHNLHGYYLNIEILFNYLKTTDIPVVWTLHDCWPFTGHCAHFDYIGCEKWKKGCYDCPITKSYPASYLKDRSKKNYRDKKRLLNSLSNLTLVPVSNWLSNILKESFLNQFNKKVIINGVDTSVFKLIQNNNMCKKFNLQNKFVLLGVANLWDKRKGLYDYFELNKLLTGNYQLLLLGLNGKQINELPKGIIGIERTDSIDELVQCYNIADVVMNISYEETFGMTTIEGFACGTPSIVYNATASPELITPETGIIVKKGDISDLIKAIYKIKENGKGYYNKACVERAHKYYKKEDRYQEYIELYNSLLKNK